MKFFIYVAYAFGGEILELPSLILLRVSCVCVCVYCVYTLPRSAIDPHLFVCVRVCNYLLRLRVYALHD